MLRSVPSHPDPPLMQTIKEGFLTVAKGPTNYRMPSADHDTLLDLYRAKGPLACPGSPPLLPPSTPPVRRLEFTTSDAASWIHSIPNPLRRLHMLSLPQRQRLCHYVPINSLGALFQLLSR